MTQKIKHPEPNTVNRLFSWNSYFDMAIEAVSMRPATIKMTIAVPTSSRLSFVTGQKSFDSRLVNDTEIIPPAIAPMK